MISSLTIFSSNLQSTTITTTTIGTGTTSTTANSNHSCLTIDNSKSTAPIVSTLWSSTLKRVYTKFNNILSILYHSHFKYGDSTISSTIISAISTSSCAKRNLHIYVFFWRINNDCASLYICISTK